MRVNGAHRSAARLSLLVAGVLLIGCGGSGPAPDASGMDSGADATSADSAQSDSADSAQSDSGRVFASRPDRPRECPATMPIADTYHWAPPRVRRGSCTSEQARWIADALERIPINEATYRAMAGDSCYDCVFSDPETANAWGAILLPSGSNLRSYGNVGGCMIAAGASLACGIAANNYGRCTLAACDGCGVADMDACVQDPRLYAPGGACSAARVDYQRACQQTTVQYQRCYGPDNISAADWSNLIITEMCGGATDGGM